MTPRLRRLAVAALIPGLVLTMSGCYSGFGATTNMQVTQNTGNGVRATLGPILIDNATLVRGPEGSASATLLMGITNRGEEADQLVSVTIDGTPATFEPAGAVDLLPTKTLLFGFNSPLYVNTYSLEAAPSAYVPVRLTFARAGVLDISVMTVSPDGIYAGVTPSPLTPPAQ